MNSVIGRKIFKGGIGSLIVKVGYIGIQFTIGVYLARILDPSGLGVYAFIMANVQILVILAQFGFPAYLVRLVSAERELGRPNSIRKLISSAQRIALSLSAIIFLLSIGALSVFETGFTGITNTVAYFGLLILPALTLSAVAGGAIRGFGHVVVGLLPDQIIRPLGLLLILLIFHQAGLQIVPAHALVAHALAAFAAMSIAQLLLTKVLPKQQAGPSSPIDYRNLLKNSLPFLLLAGTQVISQQTDIIMIGTLITQEAVGLFRVAAQVAEGMGVILFALSTTIAPEISRLHAANERVLLKKMIINCHRAGVLLLLPLGAAICLYAEPIVTSVFGKAYSDSAGPLAILAAGKVAYASVAFSGLFLSMIGHASIAASMVAATAIINIVMNLLLIPVYGVEGAAVATVISALIVNVMGLVWIHRKLGLNLFAFSVNVTGNIK